MKASLLTIRAIGAEFAKRLWFPVVIVVSIVTVLLIGLIWWISAAMSVWWWLLAIPVIFLASVALVILTVFKLLIRYVSPQQSQTQRQLTAACVNTLEAVSETAQTPKVVLLFLIIRDIAAPRDDGYVASLIDRAGSMRGDFIKLKRSFE